MTVSSAQKLAASLRPEGDADAPAAPEPGDDQDRRADTSAERLVARLRGEGDATTTGDDDAA